MGFLGRRPCSAEVRQSKETCQKVRQADFVISMATAQAITWQRQAAPSTEHARHGLPRVATLLRRSSTEQRNFPESEASRLCDLHGHRTSHRMTETEQARHGLLRAATLLRRSLMEQINFPESEASRFFDLHGHRTSHLMTETGGSLHRTGQTWAS